MDDLISVIINVYNGEKFISKCIESVINQTYRNLEILIINDGSTDNTLKICQGYKDKRIRIITTENFGLSKSRNIGIENAKGEYIYFIDSDDFVEIDVIEYLYKLCKKYKVKMATCRPITIFDYKYKVKSKKEKVQVISNYDMLKKVLLAEDGALVIWNKLIKKELFEDLRFEDRIINDLTITYKLVLKTDKILDSNQVKYYYLKHKNAITVKNNKNFDRAIDNYEAGIERYNYIKKIFPELIENDIGLLRIILKLYITENKDIEKFLYSQGALKEFYKRFTFKIFFSGIRYKEKVKILLFKISPDIFKKLAKGYRSIRYSYKM